MIHIAHDDRAIDAAFESVFGSVSKLSRPKTTKTYCGKRVVFESAQSHDKANCNECLTIYSDEQQGLSSILANWPSGLAKPSVNTITGGEER